MITRKKDAFDAKIVNMRLTKIFIAIFAPNERLPSSATLYENEKGDNFQVYWNGRQFIFLQAGVVYIIAGKNEANFGRRFKKIQAEQILDYCLLSLSTCLKEILGKGSNNQNGNLRWHLPLGV